MQVPLVTRTLRRVAPAAAVAWALAASSAGAGGLNLAWNNCASEGGVSVHSNACVANTGVNTLVGSFVPDADLAGVTGIEVMLDFIIGDGTSPIPPWWEISGTGSCRSGSLIVNSTVNPANATCVDWANGAATGGLAAFQSSGFWSIAPANEPAHRRAIMGFAVQPVAAADVVGGQEYFAFSALINNQKTAGTGSCAGCSSPACIVLNSINIVAGTTSNRVLGSGTTAGSNFANYQLGGPNCQLVPSRTRTWSAVKNLYR